MRAWLHCFSHPQYATAFGFSMLTNRYFSLLVSCLDFSCSMSLLAPCGFYELGGVVLFGSIIKPINSPLIMIWCWVLPWLARPCIVSFMAVVLEVYAPLLRGCHAVVPRRTLFLTGCLS